LSLLLAFSTPGTAVWPHLFRGFVVGVTYPPAPDLLRLKIYVFLHESVEPPGFQPNGFSFLIPYSLLVLKGTWAGRLSTSFSRSSPSAASGVCWFAQRGHSELLILAIGLLEAALDCLRLRSPDRGSERFPPGLADRCVTVYPPYTSLLGLHLLGLFCFSTYSRSCSSSHEDLNLFLLLGHPPWSKL